MESELQDGYKMTELGALPDEWEVVELKRYIKILTGYPFDSSKFNDKSGFPLIRIRDLNKKNPETFYDGDYDAGFIVKQGDILVGMDGDFNVVQWNNFNGLLNQRICKIDSVPKKADQYYIYYTLIGNIKKINDTTPQTTVKHLSTKDINNLKIPLPPLPEQHQIATILSTLDETVEHTEALIEKYKNIKAGLMADLLTRGIDEEGRIRSEDTHRFKDSALGRVPEEMDIRTIDSITTYVGSGITPRGGSEVYKSSGIPLLRSQNIHFNGLRLNNVAYIDEQTHSEMKRTHIMDYDVLLNITGASIGRCTFIPKGFGHGNVNQHVCIIRLFENVCHIFVVYILSSLIGQKQIDGLQNGLSREGLNYQQVKSIKVPFPPLQEQRRIAEILAAADQRIEKEEAYRDKLLQLKKGLMQDLLTGKVRVKDGSAQMAEQSEN